MAAEMQLRPHEMIRLLQLDLRERLLAAESLWLCLTCETCTTRCPNEFDPARVIDALREIAMRERPESVPRRIGAFHRSFLDQVRSHGRVFEFGLIASFKLRTGALFDDVTAAPEMLKRGKLTFRPNNIQGIDEVRRIFAECATKQEGR